METPVILTPSSGVNQSGVRDYNERLLLTLLQRNGPTAGSDLARIANLSPQTVSIILREMEAEGLLSRGAPIKGKVCPSCSAAAMIKRDGCEFCTACGFTGHCS